MKKQIALHNGNRIDRNCVDIMGVKMDNASSSSLLRSIEFDINKKNKLYIVTPNPEQIMLSLRDVEYKNIINSADISIPDGIGLIAGYKFLNLKNYPNKIIGFFNLLFQGIIIGCSIIFNRTWLEKDLKVIRGREFFLDLIKLANKKVWKVFFLGGVNGEAAGAKKVLERNFKNIKIEISELPILDEKGFIVEEKNRSLENAAMEKINKYAPDLLFIGMSAPKQEKWYFRQKYNLNIGGAMMVGGTFRYISGQVKLPPKIVANIGLEWLWRFTTGSQSLARIWTASVKFPFMIFLKKLSKE